MPSELLEPENSERGWRECLPNLESERKEMTKVISKKERKERKKEKSNKDRERVPEKKIMDRLVGVADISRACRIAQTFEKKGTNWASGKGTAYFSITKRAVGKIGSGSETKWYHQYRS